MHITTKINNYYRSLSGSQKPVLLQIGCLRFTTCEDYAFGQNHGSKTVRAGCLQKRFAIGHGLDTVAARREARDPMCSPLESAKFFYREGLGCGENNARA